MHFEDNYKISELLFYAFVITMFITKGLGIYDGMSLYKVLFVISFIFIFIKILFDEYTLLEIASISFLVILSFVINRVSGEKGPLIISAVIVGMRNVPLKRTMKVGLLSFGSSALLNAFIYMFRTPNVNAYLRTARLGISKSFAWDLGHPHPNTTSIVYLTLVALFLLSIDKQYKLKQVLLLTLGNLIVYYYCASNTGLITCEILIVSAYILKMLKYIPNWLGRLFHIGYPACVLFSCIFPWIISNDLLNYLHDNYLSLYGRIIQTREFVTSGNLKVFGVNVANITDSKYVIENSFLYCVVFNGLLFFILISLGYVYCVYKYIKQKRYMEVCITMCFLLEGILEPFLFNTSFKNVTIFFIGECVWAFFKEVQNSCTGKINALKHIRLGEGIIECINTIYNKVIYIIDILFEAINDKDKNEMILDRCRVFISLLLAFIIIKMWPVTKDFFNSSELYEILSERNELQKGILMENIRRFIFLFVLNNSILYVLINLIKNMYQHKKKVS